jgi:deoxyribonuclease-4
MASLERCRARMEEEGVEDVLIGLECMGRRTAWGTLQEIGEVVGRIEGVVPVVDFAHLHARGGGSLRTEEDFRQVLEEVDRFYQGRLHCHFSGIEFTEVGERRHLPLSSRQPDYRMLAGALRERKGEVTLISETPSPADGAREMVSLLRTTHG